jgi:hypothetical protein
MILVMAGSIQFCWRRSSSHRQEFNTHDASKARACPPEDVGGIYGYLNFLEATQDSKHQQHDEFLDWCGGNFDPEHFNIEEINDSMKTRRLSH